MPRETFTLSIVMPAYNEEATIGRAVEELLAADLPFSNELIVVDDGSEDGTADIVAGIEDPRLLLIRHEANQGKGARPARTSCRSTPTASTTPAMSRSWPSR
jgi:glycosyltransferase involved in cell wall biosynthesis